MHAGAPPSPTLYMHGNMLLRVLQRAREACVSPGDEEVYRVNRTGGNRDTLETDKRGTCLMLMTC